MPIDDFQCDHLFLLVGTNPLPDWVAARTLLREVSGGQVYLVHSQATYPVAKNLGKYLTGNNYRPPVYVSVSDPHRCAPVQQALREQLEKISPGTLGFNYTGGTKVMATHGYRTVEAVAQERRWPVIYSYLEDAACVMHFDPNSSFHLGHSERVGRLPETRLGLAELFNLHEEYRLATAPSQRVCGEAALPELVKIHSHGNLQRDWRNGLSDLVKSANQFLDERALRGKVFAFGGRFTDLVHALTPAGQVAPLTFDTIVRHWPDEFPTATKLAKWLDGVWLEHYVLKQFKDNANAYDLNDFGQGIEPLPKTRKKFEIDVSAMRGYQLHVVSCYSGHPGIKSFENNAKLKLFEAATRTRQLGGEAARTALVCCADSPLRIENEVGELAGAGTQIKVFGRNDLPRLKERLQEWFATGAKE